MLSVQPNSLAHQLHPEKWRNKDWHAFFDEHQAFVERILRRWVGTTEHVEDLKQEVFSVVFRKKSELPYPDGTRPWLYQCARYLVLHYYRDNGKYRERYELRSDLSQTDLKNSTSENTRLMLRQSLMQALAKVPDEQREAIILIDFEGMTGDEAAKCAGVTVDAIRARLSRGRKIFRKIYEALDEGGPYVN